MTKPCYPKIDFYFDLNDGCNLSCIMCGGRKTAREQTVMPFEIFKHSVIPVFAKASDFQFGCRYEPLLNPYYKEVLPFIKQAVPDHFRGRTVTNGTLLSSSIASAMIQSDLFYKISISVDGPNRKVYEAIRKGARFEIVRRNLLKLSECRSLHRSQTKLEIIFTIQPENINSLAEMVTWTSDLGFDILKTHKRTPQDTGYVSKSYHKVLTECIQAAEEKASSLELQFSGQSYVTRETRKDISDLIDYPSAHCAFLNRPMEIWMTPEGYLHTTCPRATAPLGNLVRQNCKDIFNSRPMDLFQQVIHTPDRRVCIRCHQFVDAEGTLHTHPPTRSKTIPDAEEVSELDALIAPEIKNDAFYDAIERMASDETIQHILEIGSSAGAGSTEAFVSALSRRQKPGTLYCLEISKPRFDALRRRYADNHHVVCKRASSIPLEKFPSGDDVAAFYNSTQTALNQYPLKRVLGWLHQDTAYILKHHVHQYGIEKIKKDHQIACFDLVLIDGSEFTGRAELDEVYGAKVIMLDDINGYKNHDNYLRLKNDPGYKLEEENRRLRNGYAIFRRKQVKQKSMLPIHFFTIVLNGQPFIRYHIEAFNKLDFPWHWHIVEGVADLKHDTAWSVSAGGRIDERFHVKGLSKDGTSSYLDEIAEQYRDQVSIYRKDKGRFWSGKLEMVNAPLQNLTEQCLLWQVDADEFWAPDKIRKLRDLFVAQSHKTAAFVYCDYFVGPRKYVTSMNTWATRPSDWLRVWRYAPGMRWTAHEPPILVDVRGRNVAHQNSFTRDETRSNGIDFQHYAYVMASQVLFKEHYYGYKNALSQWQQLQQAKGRVRPADYLAWAQPDAWADEWPQNKHGLLLAQFLQGQASSAPSGRYRSMSVAQGTAFEAAVQRLVKTIRPQAIIETGTFLGRGTTTLLWRALQENDLAVHLVTIEVNPSYHRQAKDYFKANHMRVDAVLGLSLPRQMLPTRDQIEKEFVGNKSADPSIYFDHEDQHRAELYYAETNFNVPDNRLYEALERCDFKPDLLLLDSAGHLGFLEFVFVIKHLKGPCHIILDDTQHCKHHLSLQQIKSDPRFEIIETSDEKFGFAVVRFDPVKSLVCLRTDSIGDNILASSMLPHLRKHFHNAKVHIVCQQHIASLYEHCPYVDSVQMIPSEHQWKDMPELRAFIAQLCTLKPDLMINSIYSVHSLSDLPGLEFIPKRVALRPSDIISYTKIIETPPESLSELERHGAFLRGLGVDIKDNLLPTMWLSDEDLAFGKDFFKQNGLDAANALVLFTGARTQQKRYARWADVLTQICSDNEMAIVALGGASDHAFNEELRQSLPVKFVNMCGRTTLRQAASILKSVRLAVGVDTSLAHMACAVQTDNVVVMGGGHFGRFLPYSSHTSVVCNPVSCYGCDWECGHGKSHCVDAISPLAIAFAVQQVLQKPVANGAVFVDRTHVNQNERSAQRLTSYGKWIDRQKHKVIEITDEILSDIAVHHPATHHFFSQPAITTLPLISVVTPSLNQAQFLETCIRSVLDQNYPNIEYIIMDGGSDDGTRAIIEKYADRLTYWKSCPDNGQYAAIDEGFARSTGSIMTWINADDILHPQTLRRVAAIFTRRDDVAWLTGRPNGIDRNGHPSWVLPILPMWHRKRYLDKQYKTPYIQQEGTFWRRTLWEKAGGRMEVSLSYAGDLELWARFFRYAQLFSVDCKLAAFRSHDRQKTRGALTDYDNEAERILDREIQLDVIELKSSQAKAPRPVTRNQVESYLTQIDYVQMYANLKAKNQPRPSGIELSSKGVDVLVSAIVSTCNAEKYIQGCLEDLRSQTIADRMEIIVVDSASEQDEGRVVRQFQECFQRLKYIRTPMRESVYAAWNRGIKLAEGRYVTNANTDDRHRRDAFEQMVAVLEAEPEIALVYADVIKTGTENETFAKCTPTGMLSWFDWDRKRLLSEGCFIGPQPMWRRRVHDDYGFFDESLTVSSDYEFWLRISQTNRFQRIPRPLGLYLERPDSVEHADLKLKQDEDRVVHKKYSRALQSGTILGFKPFELLRRGTIPQKRQVLEEIGRIVQSRMCVTAEPIKKFCSELDASLVRGAVAEDRLEEFIQRVSHFILTRCDVGAFGTSRVTHRESDRGSSYPIADSVQRGLAPQGGLNMQFANKIHQGILSLLDSGHAESAGWALEKFLGDYPDHAMAHHERAMLAHQRSDSRMAAIHFKRAADLAPADPAIQKSLGDFYHVVEGQTDAAIAQYQKVLQLTPGDRDTLLTMAHLYVSMRRFDEARSYYERALETDPSHMETRRILEKLTAHQAQQAPRLSPEALYQKACSQIETGQRQEAVDTLESLLSVEPGYALAHNDLGVLYYEAGDKQKAQRHYEKAAELEPENNTFQKNLADFYFVDLGAVEKAMEKYVQALTLDPQDLECLMSCGQVCLNLERSDDARVFFQRVLEIDPLHRAAQDLLANCGPDAASTGEPRDSGDLYESAQRQASAGNIPGAIQSLEQLIARDPNHAMAYNDLGVLHYEQGDKEQSLRHYELAVRLESDNPTFMKNLADFYFVEQGRVEDALIIYIKILEADREDLDALMAAGTICTMLDKDDDARTFYERVLEINPWHDRAREELDRIDTGSNHLDGNFAAFGQ